MLSALKFDWPRYWSDWFVLFFSIVSILRCLKFLLHLSDKAYLDSTVEPPTTVNKVILALLPFVIWQLWQTHRLFVISIVLIDMQTVVAMIFNRLNVSNLTFIPFQIISAVGWLILIPLAMLLFREIIPKAPDDSKGMVNSGNKVITLSDYRQPTRGDDSEGG